MLIGRVTSLKDSWPQTTHSYYEAELFRSVVRSNPRNFIRNVVRIQSLLSRSVRDSSIEFFQRLYVTGLVNETVIFYRDNITALAYTKDPKYHDQTNTLTYDITTFKMLLHKERWPAGIFLYLNDGKPVDQSY